MKKVLIIEDDQVVANIYRNKLTVEGFHVDVALDGHEGLEKVNAFRPDAVILDLMLPKIMGVDVVRKIRAETDFQQLPIIVFSNTYLSKMIEDAWKAGATKCLSKANCTPKQVLDVLRGTLGINGTTATQTGAPPKPAGTAGDREPQPVDSDAEFQAELRRSFVASFPATLAGLRTLLQAAYKADNETLRLKQIGDMQRRTHAITSNAGITGLLHIAQMADALEALLKELYDKPKNVNASTLRTVASAIDLLGMLFDHDPIPAPNLRERNVLVVDDEAISRRAIAYSLEKVKLKATCIENSLQALELLSHRKFDLVFLDVDMPNMNGFELCSKLRMLRAYAKTPVVFITSVTDFESRTNSMISGGNDFIAKPFLFLELAIKALVHILRANLEPKR